MATKKDLLRELCNLEIPNVVKFSPNGRDILYSTSLTWGHRKGKFAVSTIWLASTGQTSSSKRLTSGLFNDHAPVWHPDGGMIAFVSDRPKQGNQWAIYTLQLQDGSEPQPITNVESEQHINQMQFSPDGKCIAFISADEKTPQRRHLEENGEDVQVWGKEWPYARLRVLDLRTRMVKSLSLDRDIFGFTWSPNGKSIGFLHCTAPDLEEKILHGTVISTVDSNLNIISDVCKLPRDVKDLSWAGDGNLYFCTGLPVEKTFCGHSVYAADPDSSSMNYKKVAFGVDDDTTCLINAGGEILCKVEHRLESLICRLNGEVLFGIKAEIEAFDVFIHPDDTGKTFCVAVATSDINHPVELFSKASSDPSLLQLSNHGERLLSSDFGTCHFLSCPSDDQRVELDALYLAPRTDGAVLHAAFPTVVLVHGGPNTRITNSFNTYYFMWTPYLLSLGYGVLLPNYRGSSGRGKQFASYSIDGTGIYDYNDIITMTQNAIEVGLADKERLVVGGWSQGGFLSFVCSVRNGMHSYGWKFNASIAGAGICDSDAMALSSDLGCIFQPELNNGRVTWEMDMNDTRNRRASPLWEFKKAIDHSKRTGIMVVPPMLILHGEKDARCPLSQATGMRRALHSQNLPHEFVCYPRQGHFFAEQNFWIDLGIRVGEWCNQYIGDAMIKKHKS